MLIKCGECEKEISDKATSCPHCGTPMATATVGRPGAKWEGLGFLLIIGGMLTAMSTGDSNHFGGAIVTAGFMVFLFGRFN